MSAQGFLPSVIARRLHCHRNTITAHLAGRIKYPPSLIQAVNLAPIEFSASKLIPLYQGGCLLPEEPSPSTLHAFIRSGKLKAELKGGKYFTRLSWLKRCALSSFPAGLWHRQDNLIDYIHGFEDVLHKLKKMNAKRHVHAKRVYYRAADVHRAAYEIGATVEVPALLSLIALRRLDLVSVFVL